MSSLIIVVPRSEIQPVQAALAAAGFGPSNINVPLRGSEFLQEGQDPSEATHFCCHWWSLDNAEQIVSIVKANSPSAAITSDAPIEGVTETTPGYGRGQFSATVGDYVQIEHKQFPDTRWGWRATMKVASDRFNPGVRAVAIYADAAHRQFLYTTGAFVQSDGLWVTEWNEGKSLRADVHWAVLFASAAEVVGTLGASDAASVAYMRFGLPPGDIPTEPDGPTVQPWRQPTGAQDAYAIGDRVTHNRPQDGGATWIFESQIAANTTEPGRDGTFDRWWRPVERA